MKVTKKSPIIALGTMLLASVLYFGQGAFDTPRTLDNTQGSSVESSTGTSFKAHFVDVGQADAIILQSGEHAVLVDAGNASDADTLETYIDELGIESFDLVVGTHSHEDHIGGMTAIIEHYGVDTFLMPSEENDTRTFKNMMKALEDESVEVREATSGQTFEIGSMQFKVLAPNSSNYKDRNDYSVVLMVEVAGRRVLLTGDAETQSEHEMVRVWNKALKADILKVGHHGSGTSTTAQFLKLVSPEKAVISVGVDNKYNHPDYLILNRLLQYGVEDIKRTDQDGTVVLSIENGVVTLE
jgi:competence protein ComEC